MISAVIIAKNEEKFIKTALDSLKKIAEEIIVVVDKNSRDATEFISRDAGAKVFVRDWHGYGEQKNFALSQCSGTWILQIDADEEITDELAEEIKKMTQNPASNFYWLKIVTSFLGRPLNHSAGNNLRLFKRGHAEWDKKEIHEQVVRAHDKSVIKFGDSDSGILSATLTHHGHYATLKDYLERQEKYSSKDADEILKNGTDRQGRTVKFNRSNPISVLNFLYSRAVKTFIKKYFLRRGFLDGWEGFLWSFFSAQYEYKMCRKYLRKLAAGS